MSARFTRIEPEVLDDHSHLAADDECYFLLEYTSGRDYNFGRANSFINNFKKDVKFRARPDVWRYKNEAIAACSKALGEAINRDWLRAATLVPIPPSKSKSDPNYDDRMIRALKGISVGFPIDIRELVIQTKSLRASHEAGEDRVTVPELLDAYSIDGDLADPAPTAIGIVDDVLTAGAHFRAMTTVLSKRFAGVPIVGFFVARRVFPPEPSALDDGT